MVFSREQAVQRALAARTNSPGTCQLWTRGILGAPSVGDFDGDGDADAVDGWKREPLSARHTDRKPPAGTPVAWSGGRNGYGHRAISLGPVNGVYKIRSTDAPVSGRVGTVDLDWVERNWGLKYLGWTDTISGIPIPYDKPKPPAPPAPVVPPKPKTRGVRVERMLRDARAAYKNAAGNPTRRQRIRAAYQAIKQIPKI
jgi:hypothetical protein